MPHILPLAATAAAAAAPIATATAATATASTLSATLVSVASQAAVSMAINAAMSVLSPKVGGSGRPVDWTLNPDAPIPFAFGRVGVAGAVVHKRTFGPDKMYYGFVSCVSGAGPIAGFEAFTADDFPVTFDGTGIAVTSEWTGEMWRATRLGAQPDTWLPTPTGLKHNAILPNWTASHRASGKALSMLVMGENSKRTAYPNGEVKPLEIFRGLLCWDPRLDSTYPGGSGACRLDNPSTWVWTENPIICALRWCLGLWEGPAGKGAPHVDQQVGGIGSKLSGIDVPAFVAAANVCDANGWTCAAYPNTDDDKHQVLVSFLKAAGAIYSQRAGKISLIQRASPRASVATITADDVIGAIEVDTAASRIDRINTIQPTYWSPQHRWQMTALPEVTAQAYRDADGGKRSRGVTYPYVTNANQAAQLAALEIAHSREGMAGQVALKPYLQRIQPGDVFTITEPGFLLDGLKCLCMSTEYDPAEAVVRVTFVSETDAKYPFALGQSTTPPTPPTLVAPDNEVTPPGFDDWTVVLRPPAPGGGGQMPGFDLTGIVNNATAHSVLVEVSATTEGPWTQAYHGPPTAERIQITVDPSSTYYIAVSYFNAAGRQSERTIYGPFTTGPLVAQPGGQNDMEPPGAPTGLVLSTAVSTNPTTGEPEVSIIANWTANAEEDLAGYEVEVSQGGATIVDAAGTNSYRRAARSGSSYAIRVRAYDKAGNRSLWTASQSITGGADTVPPGLPTAFTVSASLGAFHLRWAAPADSDVAFVEVYEATTNSTTGATLIATVPALPSLESGYTLSRATGTVRWYFLRAVDTSRNRSGFTAGTQGTIPSVQQTEFASGINIPINVTVLPTTGNAEGRLVTFQGKLYRFVSGAWTAAVDGADVTANSITAGHIAAGAIGTDELAANAVTAGKIGAGEVIAEKIAAGAITADKIGAQEITTDKLAVSGALPVGLTVGPTGATLGTIRDQANNPAARVNENTTLIAPGRIQITGSTDLSNWKAGPNSTEIRGGAIAANSVAANKLEIGARGVTFDRFNFRTSGNTLTWDTGRVAYTNDAGAAVAFDIAAGSHTYSAAGGDVTWLFWSKDAASLSTTKSLGVAVNAGTVLIGSYYGGKQFTASYGKTLIDETGISTPSLSAISANLGAVTAGSININNRFIVAADGTVTMQSGTTGARKVETTLMTTLYDDAGRLRMQMGIR